MISAAVEDRFAKRTVCWAFQAIALSLSKKAPRNAYGPSLVKPFSAGRHPLRALNSTTIKVMKLPEIKAVGQL